MELGKRHGIVLLNNGEVYGWGDGTYGEIGIIQEGVINKPILIPFFKDKEIIQISAGARHSLALDSQGNIYAMGDNSEG